uniref:uncharacterized protein LOC117162944 n=1 Tax=Bombus vancouverensis nearcticus TaxID=2705178 RepID=UPI00143A881C|nr:uncharacterized protein LOC117162944 [Bombus vancouverensis nearcticus]
MIHQHRRRKHKAASHLMSPSRHQLNCPEIHLPTFDGTIENWHSFYDSFLSTIDRSERLTPVQKFHHLRSSLTGKAARSIQSLDVTELNYSIAIDVLKEKFDCHRQVCMRYWDLIFDYPKITKETPEAIDDFLETVKVNLQALEKLGEPVTSNVALIKLFTSKLPSAIIRKWQRTLPDKKMPSYRHLVDFLKTRTNGDRTSSASTVIKRESDQHKRQRPNAPRSYAFTSTHNTLVCPNCQGQHELWNCDVFKAKSPKKRLEIAKRASLCTNCLGTEPQKTDSLISLPSEPLQYDLLVTAQVNILNNKVQPFRCRALLDTASLCIGQLDICQANGPDLRLQKTRFGWVIGGSPTSQSSALAFHASTTALQADLARFWEIDE